MSDFMRQVCSCGKPFPEDGGKEGVCECCSTCLAGRLPLGVEPMVVQSTRAGRPVLLGWLRWRQAL